MATEHEQQQVAGGGKGEDSLPSESAAVDGPRPPPTPLLCDSSSSADMTTTPTKKRTMSGCNTPSGSSFTALPIMREQDADLLESMHYAASQVSQYSPGGTPVLRPIDRSLPMEEMKLTLTPMSSTRELLMRLEGSKHNHESRGNAFDHQVDSIINTDDWEDVGDDSDVKSLQRDFSTTAGESASSHMKTAVSRSSLRTSFNSDDNVTPSQSSESAFFKSVTFSEAGNKEVSQNAIHTSTASLSGLSHASSITNIITDGPLNSLRVPELTNPSTQPTTGLQAGTQQLQTDPNGPQHHRRPSFRRLLSGEIRTIHPAEDDPSVEQSSSSKRAGADPRSDTDQRQDHHHHHEIHTTMAGEEMIDGKPASTGSEEEETTTASPLSVLQEAEKANAKEESGLAERRRVNEAIQFAQAVGEEISINRNDLRIIEDNEEEDDDDDDDEAIEAKEVVTMPSSSLHQYDDRSMSHHGPEDLHTTAEHDNDVSFTDGATKTHGTPLPKTVDIRPSSHGPPHHRRHKSRPTWPFEQPADSEPAFMEHLSDGPADRTNFVYHGIQSNPPEITTHGIQRGNYAQLHRKAWLEVSDKYHRYGKNLRLYYRYWERLGFPTNQFFDWLDSKGEAAGQPLPILDECPRSVLDSDTVLYIANPKVTDGYALDIGVSSEDGRGRVVDVDGDPVLTGPDGWIFVLRDNVMYGAPKITSISGHSKQRFHHSSFFGGKAVASAGIMITDDEGYLMRLYPHSGHYRPSESHMQRMLLFLYRKGVDLRTFEVDTQQLSHLSREKDTKLKEKKSKNGNKDDGGSSISNSCKKEKAKKVDSLHLEKAIDVACYLAHKADFIGKGIFDKIHQIRKADVTSVTEALTLVDNGGYWTKTRKPQE
jgi:hypothetical protein